MGIFMLKSMNYGCAKAPDQIWKAPLVMNPTTGDEPNPLVPASRDAARWTSKFMLQLFSCALPCLHVNLVMRYLTRTEVMSELLFHL
jgi:hypothetical protein